MPSVANITMRILAALIAISHMVGSVVGLHEGGYLSVELLHAGLVDQAEVNQGVAARIEHIAIPAPLGIGQAQFGARHKHALGVFEQVGKSVGDHGNGL